MTGKRNLFLGLLIGLVLGGALSSFLSFHSWTSAQDSRTVLLRQGWNQLVWSANNQPAAYAFSDIVDDLTIVYGWRDDSQTFTRYITGRGDVSTMSMLERDRGYWLLVKRDLFLTMPARFSECPAPTTCPQCPDPSDLLAEHLLSSECTAAKLGIGLMEITDKDTTSAKKFFAKNCQGVQLLRGSHLTEACASAGLLAAGGDAPVLQLWGQQAAILLGQYCVP